MDKNILSSLRFKNYVVEKIDYVFNEDFNMDNEIELNLGFDRDIEVDIESNVAIVRLACKVFDGYRENNYPFYLKVVIRGFFEFESELNNETVKEMLEINATAILFPYLRALISNITSSSGVSPLVIPTINIVNMIKNSQEKHV